MMVLADVEIETFRDTVWGYFKENARILPWRENITPYTTMVSEMMLQQTQVSRVTPKFEQFIAEFPTIGDLSRAPFRTVLAIWSGLGYNRRAQYLHKAAQQVVSEYHGDFPHSVESLTKLAGIGVNTAGAIMVYAFEMPVVFIETNIRTVLFHHFFNADEKVPDSLLRSLMGQLMDREQPREWYWALMDYGTSLKRRIRNNAQSLHYQKQSSFKGSRRELRGKVLRLLLSGPCSLEAIVEQIQDERLLMVLGLLRNEGLIQIKDNIVGILDYSGEGASSTIET